MASTCWCPTIPPPGRGYLMYTINAIPPNFPLLFCPFSLSISLLFHVISGKIRIIFITVDTPIPRIGEDTMGEEIRAARFLSLSLFISFVALDCCTGLAQISRVGCLGRCLMASLEEAPSSARR